VRLDLRGVDMRRFPNVHEALRGAGLDPATEPVPLAPAAHYTMGGIATDIDGRSTVPGLFAVGECACTGLHGANRLASNSLAECFVFGGRAAVSAGREPDPPRDPGPPPTPLASPVPPDESRAALWRHAGIERSREDLSLLLDDPFPPARRIAAMALLREESRGAHQRTDRPETDPKLDEMHAVVRGDDEPSWERWE
jgi:L-aspartate oxidase